ncbi:MAG TPA: GPR1/FUN34/YaaH family transporter, partial [Amycolatopsis sp.]|nr:GPR1/FUN34/YaaH family transporter [Amycolatopsis sp.]
MTTVDATAGESGRPATASKAPAAEPVVGPMAGDPAMLGLSSFIVGSVALGLGLVGVVPVGVLGAPLAIILAATALGLLLAAIWAAAVGQSAVGAVFGIFGTFWLSYG